MALSRFRALISTGARAQARARRIVGKLPENFHNRRHVAVRLHPRRLRLRLRNGSLEGRPELPSRYGESPPCQRAIVLFSVIHIVIAVTAVVGVTVIVAGNQFTEDSKS